MNRIQFRAAAAVVFFSFASLVMRAQTVPPEYLDLNTTLQGSISSFNSSTLALWNGSKPPVTFAAHLATLNSNNGPSNLDPSNYASFLHEMDGLKALGVTAVVVNIDFPVLDPGFDAFGGQAEAYLNLYQSAARDIHGRGLKMIVETGAIFTDPVFSPLNVSAFYSTLSLTDYMAGRARQAALIATSVQPDYLNVVQEPDTEAKQCGFNEVNTLEGSLNLLNTIVDSVHAAGGSDISLGAGIGTWLATDSTGKTYADYIRAYAAVPGLDKIDIHVYPVVRDFLARLNTIAQIANTAGKRLTMTEAWAYKERDVEVTNSTYSPSTLFARDVFSFWAPVDTQFLQAMVNWSYYQNLDFMAAFWSQYFRAYITYDDITKNLPPAQLFALAQAAAGAAMKVPSVTTTGTGWYSFITNGADTNPPTAPVITYTSYPNQVVLNWSASDDVGIYKYTVSRAGTPTITTVDPIGTEANLTSCGKYVWTVTAYDFKNNRTFTSTPTITTPDNVAPTAPTSLTVTAGGVVQGSPATTSMRLVWSGATDNCGPSGIASYAIYRSVGSDAGPWTYVTQAPSSPLYYTDSGLQKSATLYCYKIDTVDGVSLKSPDSPTACAMSKDFRAPTVPSGLKATMGTPPVVTLTWNASTDDVAVASYDIQRRQGTSGAFNPPISVPTPGYTDNAATPLPDSVPPTASIVKPVAGSTVSKKILFQASVSDRGVSTTYTYQVRAVDTSGNKSVYGTASTITWPATAGVASVSFLVDGNQVYSSTAAPYYFTFDTKSVSNGAHTFAVTATDKSGNSATSNGVVVTVAN